MSTIKSVLGLVRNQPQVDTVVEALLHTGFSKSDVSTLYVDKPATGAFVRGQGLPKPEHMLATIGIGGAVGVAIGLLAGVGFLTIPGFEPLLLGGPLAAVLSGVVLGGTAGTMLGTLAGMGLSQIQAAQYEDRIKNGAILVSIHVDDRDQRAHAKKILRGYGATNIATVGDVYAHPEALRA